MQVKLQLMTRVGNLYFRAYNSIVPTFLLKENHSRNSSPFYGNSAFIIVLEKALLLTILLFVWIIRSTHSNFISLRKHSIFYSLLRLGFRNFFFPSATSTKFCLRCVSLLSCCISTIPFYAKFLSAEKK